MAGKGVFLPSTALSKVFDMDFSQKVLCGVFELPLLRNAHTQQIKKYTYIPHLVAICQIYVAYLHRRFKKKINHIS
jgi:hypothetical protein